MTDLFHLYRACRLCPRRCGIDRENGKRGVCGTDARLRVGRASLHLWEEPCLVGANGSGAVFFGGCPLGCVFCQNRMLSRGGAGVFTDADRLADSFLSLQEQGACNLNLVSASHFLPHVVAALDLAKGRGFCLPVVYNSSGYESTDTLAMLDGLIDIYLPDLKSLSPSFCRRFLRAPDYPAVAREAIAAMVRQTGAPIFDGEGRLLRGTIVRHLVMPDGARGARAVLRHLADYGDGIIVSLMSQYTPTGDDLPPPLDQRVSPVLYASLCREARRMGISRLYTQAGESADESFIPEFNGEGVELD